MAVTAGRRLFETAEITGDVRPPEFVIKRRTADRAFQHDVQRRCDSARLAVFFFPRLYEAGNFQVRDGKTGQSSFSGRTATGRALVADFAAGTGCGARMRRNRCRVIMRFDLHQ